MFFRDVLKIASINVRRRKTRSFLTALSIMIGVSSVLTVSSVGNGGEKLITKELEKLGLQGIAVYQNKNEKSAPLSSKDAETLEKRFENIDITLPVVMEFGTFKMNKVTDDAVFLGVGEHADMVYNVTLLHGRIPNASDVDRKKRVVVIDDELATKVYHRVNVVGKELMLNFANLSEKFEVIGIIKSQKDGINQMFGNSLPDFLYLPYSTLNEMRGSEELSQIAVKCISEYNSDGTEFAEYLSKIKAAPNGYTAENVSSKMGEIKSITGLVSLLISAVASIALCVAGLGIMNTMFSSTTERKREIGVCMAIGAKSSDIMLCFLSESIIIALIGGTLGAIIGYSLAFIVSYYLKLGFILSIKSFLLAEAVSFVCGGIFSVIPAVRASRLEPIEALRRN